jgi:hypothetical protein
MTQAQEQQAMQEIYSQIPQISPTEMELMDMFEQFMANKEEEIPTLPRGFGQ